MNNFGKFGEDLAVIYLWFHGYSILDRNFSSRFGEIDIIAKKRNRILFVEVKARGTNSFASPASYVDEFKQRKIIKTAQLYILYKKLYEYELRFDVIEVTKKYPFVTRIKNAF